MAMKKGSSAKFCDWAGLK